MNSDFCYSEWIYMVGVGFCFLYYKLQSLPKKVSFFWFFHYLNKKTGQYIIEDPKSGSAYINCEKIFFSKIVWYGVGMPNLSLRSRKCGGQLLVAEKPRNFRIFSSFSLISLPLFKQLIMINGQGDKWVPGRFTF